MCTILKRVSISHPDWIFNVYEVKEDEERKQRIRDIIHRNNEIKTGVKRGVLLIVPPRMFYVTGKFDEITTLGKIQYLAWQIIFWFTIREIENNNLSEFIKLEENGTDKFAESNTESVQATA